MVARGDSPLSGFVGPQVPAAAAQLTFPRAHMGAVETKMFDFIESRLKQGALSVCETEIMDTVIPSDHPEFRERPAYRHGLERLLRRHMINAIDATDGTRHFFIGTHASAELRASLGL